MGLDVRKTNWLLKSTLIQVQRKNYDDFKYRWEDCLQGYHRSDSMNCFSIAEDIVLSKYIYSKYISGVSEPVWSIINFLSNNRDLFELEIEEEWSWSEWRDEKLVLPGVELPFQCKIQSRIQPKYIEPKDHAILGFDWANNNEKLFLEFAVKRLVSCIREKPMLEIKAREEALKEETRHKIIAWFNKEV